MTNRVKHLRPTPFAEQPLQRRDARARHRRYTHGRISEGRARYKRRVRLYAEDVRREPRCEEEHHTEDDDNCDHAPHHVDHLFGPFIKKKTHAD